MCGGVEVAHGLVVAVDGKGVLDEVVGSNGHEVALAGEDVAGDGGGGYFDHATKGNVFVKRDPLSAQLFHGLTDVPFGFHELRET